MTGVIGLGGMGSGIAGTLLRSGMDLVVYDIDPTRVQALQSGTEGTAAGSATAADDVADLCARCDTVILSLPSSHVAVEVLDREVVPAVGEGSVVIDMGTTLVRETRRLAQTLAARGVGFLDAPVSGGTVGAAKGELFVFVGGDRSVADSRWELLKKLGGGRLTWCGPSGSGQITKAVNQLCMGLVDAAFLEAVAFGVNGGVDAKILSEAVGGDGGFRDHLRRIADRVAAGDGDGNDVKYAEHAYFLDFARQAEFPTPMLEALYAYMSRFPETARDNMNRPYPPLWSALTSGTSGSGKTGSSDDRSGGSR